MDRNPEKETVLWKIPAIIHIVKYKVWLFLILNVFFTIQTSITLNPINQSYISFLCQEERWIYNNDEIMKQTKKKYI